MEGYISKNPLPKFKIARDRLNTSMKILGSTFGLAIDTLMGKNSSEHEISLVLLASFIILPFVSKVYVGTGLFTQSLIIIL